MLIDIVRNLYRLRYRLRARLLSRHTIESIPPIFQSEKRAGAAEFKLDRLCCAYTGKPIFTARNYQFFPRSLGRISNVRIVPDSGYMITPEKRIVCTPHFNTRFLADVLNHKSILDAANRTPSIHFEWAFYLLGPWYRNYYHWLIDFCPLLQTFEEFTNRNPSATLPVLLYPKGLPSAYEDILNHLWRRPERFKWNGEVLSIGNLMVPSIHKGVSRPRVIEGAPPSPASIQWLQEKIWPHLTPTSNRRLLISRSKAPSRRLDNEPELMDALSCLGFQLVHLEDHSFLEQASLFHHAEAVVGCHGAGLANLVFCNRNTAVVEIFPQGVARCDYTSIARVMNLPYRGIQAIQQESSTRDASIKVEAMAIVNVISNLLSRARP